MFFVIGNFLAMSEESGIRLVDKESREYDHKVRIVGNPGVREYGNR